MDYLPQVIFLLLAATSIGIFAYSASKIRRNILLGKPEDRSGNTGERLRLMTLFALGQKKMFKRPISAILHFLVYAGFILVNIEILEIIIDGLFGTHRSFAPLIGNFYAPFITAFEFLAVAVIVSCAIFLIRRNIVRVKRFWASEMTAWPRLDANLILVVEIILMTAFLTMNAADMALQKQYFPGYAETGIFFFSQTLLPFFDGMSPQQLVMVERIAWWTHIIGVFIFLNYIPFSKHLHIFLAFPNTYYSKLAPMGAMKNMDQITQEVKLMLDPSAAGSEPAPPPEEMSFGAKDAHELTWKQLLDSYTCTECGRCTAVCPANQTGKLLSPRKIMMDTRDRIEEIGKNGGKAEDGKTLLGDYITREEINACTACNACVEACPVNIDPLSIIFDLRRQMVMEAANPPQEWNQMFTNIENNGAPWQYSPADRAKWAGK